MKKYLLTLGVLFTFVLPYQGIAQTYCTPSTYSPGYMSISSVQLNTINNVSYYNNGYADYTSMSTSLIAGNSYTITLGNTYSNYYGSGTWYGQYASVWIDYNKNGIFESSEMVVNNLHLGSYGSASFTIPTSGFVGGLTRLRVKTEWDGYSVTDPCSGPSWGETEDYTVNLSATALNFSNSRVDLGTTITNQLTGTNKITVEAWVNPTSNSGLACIVGNYNTSAWNGQYRFLLRRDNSNYGFYIGTGSTGGTASSPANSVALNTWQHVVGTWDGTTVRIFINGVLAGTSSCSGTFSSFTNAVWIGGNTMGSENFTGSIDEVRIWSRPVCGSEIQNYMNCELNASGQTGLLGLYHFNQGIPGGNNSTVTTLTDASGNNVNGTLSGFALTGSTSNWIAPGGVTGGTCSAYTPPAITVSTLGPYCVHDTIKLFTSPGSSYSWTGPNGFTSNVQNPVILNASQAMTGTYNVTVNNANGCISSGSVSVTIQALPVVTTANGGPVCQGGTATLSVNSALTYNWTGPNSFSSTLQSPSITNAQLNATGLYTVKITGSNGCRDTASTYQTIRPLPSVTASSNSPVVVGNTVNLVSNGASTYSWTGPNGFISTAQSPSITNAQLNANGVYSVTGTNSNGCSASASTPVSVLKDSDGDSVADLNDADDDNDGILDVTECNQSNFYWSSTPAVNGNTATGTINGINYTYTSSQPISTTTYMYANNVFPGSYGVPDANPTIANIYVTNNTLSFSSPMTNPVLVFASIGQPGVYVPITFSAPIQVVWSQNVVQNSSTQITGNEGYAIIRMMGTYTSISFNYLAQENWCNFAFGADFQTCGDTDNDGTPDFADADSDGDGCPDALEGGASFTTAQILNGMLTGTVASTGIPALAGSGQTIGNSQIAAANCFCELGNDQVLPSITAPADITMNVPSCQTGNINVNLGTPTASDNCTFTLSNNAPASFNVGTTSVTWTALDGNGNTSTATQTVTITKSDVMVLSHTKDINCSGPNSGSIVATITGGRAPIQYQLNSGAFQSSNTFSNLAPGIYSLTAKDADNCTAVANQITLVEPFCLQAQNDSFENCAGQPITIQKSTLLGNDANPWNVSIYMDVAQPANGTLVDNGTSITYTPHANFTGVDQFNYTIKKNDGTIAYAGNGHVYEWVPAYGITWNSARIGAGQRYYNGMQGYLVTVTSAAEMGFVSSKLQGAGWMGASDRAYEGEWRWVTGPEGLEESGLGRHFSNQFKYDWCAASTAPALIGQYANWSGSEPNDCGAYPNQYSPTDPNRGGEHYAHFYGGGVWNDYPNDVGGNITGYIVEYGGMEGAVASTGTSTATIKIDNKRVLIAETITHETCTGAADGSITLNVSGGTAPYTYNWGGGIATANRTGLAAGTYAVTVTDAKGCSSSKTMVVNMVDNNPPVAIAQNITVSLNASGNVSITATQVNNGSNDACGIQSMTLSPSSFNCSNIGPNTVTLTVTDVNNNSSTVTAEVTVLDDTPPSLTCPADIHILASSAAGTVVNYTTPTATDNCSVTLTRTAGPESGSTFPIGITTVTYKATDATGNSVTCSFTVNVTGLPPVIVNPGTITVNTDAGDCGAIVQYAANETTGIPASVVTYSINPGSHFNVGTTSVTATATNAVGSSSCTFDVVVEDNEAPNVLTQDLTVELDNNGSAVIQAESVNNGSTDNCEIASYQIDKSSFDCSDIGTNTVQLTVTDIHGNSATQTATVTVNDVTAPEITSQGSVILYLDQTGHATLTLSDVERGSTDNCGIDTMYLSQTTFDCTNVLPKKSKKDQVEKTKGKIGSNQVGFTVIDNSGNVSVTKVLIEVLDTIAPAALTQDITVDLDENGDVSITADQINNGSSDACGIASISLKNSSFNCSNVGPNTVTLTVTDVNGNSSTATATVTVNDVTPPVVATQDISVDLDATGNGTITADQINNGSSDVCGIASISLDNSSFNCSNAGPNTVTLTVIDVNGNSATATAIVTVNDVTPPVVITQTISVNLDATGNGTITAAQINNGSSDACGIASISIDNSSFSCANVGPNTVTLTVTDVHGNVNAATATVNVSDVTPPVVLTQNVSVTISGGSASITAAQINNVSTDACGIATVTVSPSTFNCSHIGNNTVTLTVTDVNGNVSTGTATVTVKGVVPSCSISAAASGTIIGSATTYAAANQMFLGYGKQSMTLTATATGAGPFTYSWNGSNLSTTSGATTVFTPTAGGTYTFICTSTNSYGCQTTCTITICVIDARDPNSNANNPKVIICHLPPGNPNNRQTLSVGISAVPAHVGLHGGDKLGSCNAVCGYAKSDEIGDIISEETVLGEVDLIVFPNPSRDQFTLRLESPSDETMTVTIYDMQGRVIEQLDGISPKEPAIIGANYQVGIYIAEVIQGEFHRTVKINKYN